MSILHFEFTGIKTEMKYILVQYHCITSFP